MAKNKVIFDDTNYSVDEESLATATVELQSHLSTVMNGSGAKIRLGGIDYNIDSTKLSNATNTFVNHLGTVPGSGLNVIVGGVKYSVDSAKMTNAFAEIHAVLGGLHSDDDSSNEDVDAITWDGNTEGLLCVPIDDNEAFYKVSDKVFSNDQLRNMSVSFNADGEIFVDSLAFEWSDFIKFGWVTDNCTLLFENVVIVRQAGIIDDFYNIMFPEVGTYFVKYDYDDGQGYVTSLGITEYDHNHPNLHPTSIPLDSTGRTTPRNDDTYKYGDYFYKYYDDQNGWQALISNEVTDKYQTTYGPILESINGKPVTSLRYTFERCESLTTAPVIPEGVTNMYYTFKDCPSLTTAPVIPEGVINMMGAFRNCISLTSKPTIPSSVETADRDIFGGCIQFGYDNVEE